MTIGASLFSICGFVVANVYPRVRWWSINFDMPDGVYEHGWPASYMTRKLYPPEADMGGIIYLPWPLVNDYGPAKLLEFRPVWLGVDIVIAILLIVASASAIEPIVRRWKSPLTRDHGLHLCLFGDCRTIHATLTLRNWRRSPACHPELPGNHSARFIGLAPRQPGSSVRPRHNMRMLANPQRRRANFVV
jgi:hypothetical protein